MATNLDLFIGSVITYFLISIFTIGISGKPSQPIHNSHLPEDWRDLLTDDVYNYHVNNPNSGHHFESDILGLDKDSANPNARLSDRTHLQRNAITDRSLRWERGVVPYEISQAFTSAEKEIMEEALNDMMRKTCVRFVPYNGQVDYVSFVKRGLGCASYVARTGGKQLIDLMPGCVYKIGEVQHEVMHALGFYHEQSRTDRDNYVTIIWSNIKAGAEDQFSTYRSDPQNVPYDYASIMHYGWNYFAKDNSKPTILPKVKAALGSREIMSRGDVAKINRLYDCPELNVERPVETTESVTTDRRPVGTPPRWNTRPHYSATTTTTTRRRQDHTLSSWEAFKQQQRSQRTQTLA